MQADVDALRNALGGEDDAAVKAAFDKLSQSQTKLGEAIYASGDQTGTAGAAGGADEPAADAGSSNDEDIVDAEIVDDEEPKK